MKKYLILALALALASSVSAAGVSNSTATGVGVSNSASSAVTGKVDPTLQIINPNGHEFYYMGSPIRIKWQASSNFGNVKIEWREPITNGISGTIAVVPATQGYYDWTPTADVGVVPADTYSIWIYSVDKPQTVRTSSLYPFSIKASATDVPTINLKSPKSGEVWHRGETKLISWNTKNVPATAFINIRLIDTTSGKVSEILTHVPNTGTASWKVDKKKDVIIVNDIMIKDPITISPDATVLDALEVMRNKQIGCLPVVDKNELVGIITETDFLRITGRLIDRMEHVEEDGE